MMIPLFMMDGITVQHAGELLFETCATVRQRAQCATTYLRCLEDVTFALTFGGGFAVTRDLPKVGNETPGASLCAHFSGYIRPIEEARTKRPDAVIAQPGGVRAVAGWLQGLHLLKDGDLIFWRELALRESDAYLWPQGEEAKRRLLRTDVPVSQLEFGKDYFGVRPDLNRHVPRRLIKLLADEVLLHHSIPEPNAAEFVQRFIVAHAIIFEWYLRRRMRGAAPETPLTHLPHVTRTTFVAEEMLDRVLWRLGRLVMPLMLGEILRGCDCRADVLKRIEDLIADGSLGPLRNNLRKAIAGQEAGDIEKIRRDIEQHRFRSDAKRGPVDMALKAGLVGPLPRVEAEARLRIDDEESQYDAAIGLVLRRSPDVRAEERVQAERVFPELKR
jgi:hypothetical protein